MQREKSQEVEVTIMFNCMGIVTDIPLLQWIYVIYLFLLVNICIYAEHILLIVRILMKDCL